MHHKILLTSYSSTELTLSYQTYRGGGLTKMGVPWSTWSRAWSSLLEIEAVRVSAGSYWVWQVSERKKSDSRGRCEIKGFLVTDLNEETA